MSDLAVSHTLSQDGSVLEVSISGRLAIDTAPTLLELFTTQMPAAQKIRLSVSSLEEIDLAGMQLICSACRTALAEGKSFNFRDTLPPCVQEAINVIGLKRYTTCKHNITLPCIWCGGLN